MISNTEVVKVSQPSEILAQSGINFKKNTSSPITITLAEDQVPSQPNLFRRFMASLFEKDGCCSVDEVKTRVTLKNAQLFGTMSFQRF